MNHKLDNDKQVFFYEQEFYVFSNFSSFRLLFQGVDFDTSEHAYHWCKFSWPIMDREGDDKRKEIQEEIRQSRSAHNALKIAHKWTKQEPKLVYPEWGKVKVSVMKRILQQKVLQHEYVKKKLLETGERALIEDSWRDSFWGWGVNKDGQNQLGKLWMEIRREFLKKAENE